jgi:response regulator RpfG family c-di-GMP phosphodiesterase
MNIEKHKILIVDDEIEFLKLMKEFLEEESYNVLTAESGEKGIEILKENDPISVVISDQKMSGISGLEFLETVKKTNSRTIRMLISGSVGDTRLEELASSGDIFYYTAKPINLMTVLGKIESGIEQYEKNLA